MSLFQTALKIRQLFDKDTWTYTYLVWDERTKEATIIDSVLEKKDRDIQLIKELGLSLKYAMETHVHADHITASGHLRDATGCRIVLHKNSGVSCADDLAIEGDIFHLGDHPIHILHTPGHTDNDITYQIQGALFTGDTMLIRDCGRTDFQLGSTDKMYQSLNRLLALPDDTLVLPAHDYKGFSVSTIGEERYFNTRVGMNKPYDEFKQIMDNLNLPAPSRIQIAVPGNQRCGLTETTMH
jgi:glyoxylase-like metal-dependent hydrolase (beta-lactamase superfamily II)